MNLDQYLPVILFILVGAGVGVAPQVLGFLLGPNKPDKAKNSPYECGFEAFEDARMKFDVRYYLIAILFILFDLEIAFLFPWAVVRERKLAEPVAPKRLPEEPLPKAAPMSAPFPCWSSTRKMMPKATSTCRVKINVNQISIVHSLLTHLPHGRWQKIPC